MLLRRRSFVMLIAWMTLAPMAFAQSIEEEDRESIRSSAHADQSGERPDLMQVVDLIIEQTNEFRRQEGLQPVEANDELKAAAEYFAGYMAKTDEYGHAADGKRPSERASEHGYEYCIVSENIAAQFSSVGFETKELAEKFVEGWKNSPEHRKNMLDSAVTEIGVAVAQSPETGYFYAVQMFGRPESASIKFSIENRTETTLHYQIGKRTFSLPPRFTRTHQRCRPTEVVFSQLNRPDTKGETVQPQGGESFVVTAEGEKLQVATQ